MRWQVEVVWLTGAVREYVVTFNPGNLALTLEAMNGQEGVDVLICEDGTIVQIPLRNVVSITYTPLEAV